MCPRTTMMKRKIGVMDMKLFKKIVDEASKYTNFLWLHDFGDPILDPKIIERIKYAKSKGIKIGISVNALFLPEKISKQLIESELDHIIFSFDGFSKETYEKYRVGGNFEDVKRNILAFLRLKKEMKSKYPYVQMKMINMKETTNEIEDFKKEWKNKVDEVIITEFMNWAGQIGDEERINEITIKKQINPCKWFWTNIVVLFDGRVTPCCRDCDAKLIMGDLNKNTIKEIWNGKKYKEIRKQQIMDEYNNPLCCN